MTEPTPPSPADPNHPGQDHGSPTSPSGNPPETSDELALRLDELDALYEQGKITATELGDARRALLTEGLEHHTPAAEPPPPAAPPLAAPPPPAPERTATAAEPPPPPPPTGPRREVPPWLVPALAAIAVVGVIAIGLFLVLRGDDNGSPTPTASTPTPPVAAEYPTPEVNAPLTQLTSSAVAIGKELGQISQPRELKSFNRNAQRQIDLVEEARRRLSRVRVAEGDREAHQRLIAAAAQQRRYLVQLVRASAAEPNQANLRALDRARKAGADTIAAYRAFFAAAPAAADAITATDLTDTSGLRAAISKTIAQQTAPAPTPSPAPTPTPAPSPPSSGGSSGSGFQSPTGNLHCQDQGSQLFCSSSNDSFGVWLPEYGAPTTGSGIAAGGGVLPYGNTWVSASGAFSCSSSTAGITCQNRSGDGFFLSRESYYPR